MNAADFLQLCRRIAPCGDCEELDGKFEVEFETSDGVYEMCECPVCEGAGVSPDLDLDDLRAMLERAWNSGWESGTSGGWVGDNPYWPPVTKETV